MTTISKIELSLYPYHIYTLCTDNRNEIVPQINRFIRKHYLNEQPLPLNSLDSTTNSTGFVVKNDGYAFIVLPLDMESNNTLNQLHHIPTLMRVCAHEALHCTSFIMDSIDIRWDPNNDEPIAYLVGHIAKHSLNAFIDFLSKKDLLQYITLNESQAKATLTPKDH